MPSSRIPDDVRKVFTETFSARDIAEPLASFDADAPAAAVRAFLQARDFDLVGVRRDGRIAGYVQATRLAAGACGDSQSGFEGAPVLDDGAPLLRVLMTLNQAPFAFVSLLGQVGGIVTRADLQKPPVRMWLFGIVTLIETRFAELIERHCPEDGWKKHLSESAAAKGPGAAGGAEPAKPKAEPGGLPSVLRQGADHRAERGDQKADRLRVAPAGRGSDQASGATAQQPGARARYTGLRLGYDHSALRVYRQ
ncbi:MAG: hypothetical protein U0793_32100 [Gemmataceae bacterium]